jgi:hypothetical protein
VEAAVAAVAAGAEAEAGDADPSTNCVRGTPDRISRNVRHTKMNTCEPKQNTISKIARRLRWAAILCVVVVALGLLVQGCASTSTNDAKGFWSQEDAVKSFIDALRTDDLPALKALLGKDGQDIISSGDQVADNATRERFVTLYDEKHSIVADGPDKATLVVGKNDWPLPIPLVRDGLEWRFDAAAGREEIVNRRIGGNELAAIQVCEAIGDAERDYALLAKNIKGLREYAQKFFSDPGKHNGLYWPPEEGVPPSPLGELVADATEEGYQHVAEKRSPYHGYYYRILTSQGPDAPDGALDYIASGRMVLGFAVLAEPADYGNSGIMTFIMGSDGVIFQKDLGENTAEAAKAITAFNPDAGWTKVNKRDATALSGQPEK